jgi:hypothetical protein
MTELRHWRFFVHSLTSYSEDLRSPLPGDASLPGRCRQPEANGEVTTLSRRTAPYPPASRVSPSLRLQGEGYSEGLSGAPMTTNLGRLG